MRSPTTRFLLAPLALLAGLLTVTGPAVANTSHEGWPQITGVLLMNKQDQSRPLDARDGHGHNELLGGHGNDTIYAGPAGDVIWGDYKPSGQPASQVDHLNGGAGRDFIFASHGTNVIQANGGNDWVKAHYGRGSIDCGGGTDVLYISRKAQKHYKIRGCETISHKTLGH
jgi:Ca2+-binding RTX toxin-like protein